MTGKSVLKRVFAAFLLMIPVCVPQSAGARNAFASRVDTINISKSFSNLSMNINQILQSAQDLLNDLSDNMADDADPVNLNLKFDFHYDIKNSQSFLLIQVVYNTLAGEDGMISQIKDKEIKKFDQKTLNKLKKQFTKRSNKEIKKLCKGDRPTQKDLKRKIKKLLDGIQIKEK